MIFALKRNFARILASKRTLHTVLFAYRVKIVFSSSGFTLSLGGSVLTCPAFTSCRRPDFLAAFRAITNILQIFTLFITELFGDRLHPIYNGKVGRKFPMSAYSADKESQIGGQKIKNGGLPSVADKDC